MNAVIELSGPELRAKRVEFGYVVAGPMLAHMLWQLQSQLQVSSGSEARVVFFCARGGLVIRRLLEMFARRLGLHLQLRYEDFMVSRLAAFRAAFQLDPLAVAPLIEMEFAGRTCVQALHALTDLDSDGDMRWDVPFQVGRFLQLIDSTELGRRMRDANDDQSALLRRHIDVLRGPNRVIMLCDTGVFGSILRYLQVGVPSIDWRMTLLFRANYKRISAPHFQSTVGVMSEVDAYLPWRSVTVPLLYWQFIEAMLEPDVPSVRYYRTDSVGRVVSDLEIPDWQDRLTPRAGSVLAGAYSYLGELTPASVPSIVPRGWTAWNELRRRIVFPTAGDVWLLAVGRRILDFGTDETVEFTHQPDNAVRSVRQKLSTAAASMWPEGELRKQFPHAAGVLLLGLELFRTLGALGRECFFPQRLWRALVSYTSRRMSP